MDDWQHLDRDLNYNWRKAGPDAINDVVEFACNYRHDDYRLDRDYCIWDRLFGFVKTGVGLKGIDLSLSIHQYHALLSVCRSLP